MPEQASDDVSPQGGFEPAHVDAGPIDTAPMLIDTVVAGAAAVERWLRDELESASTGPVARVAPTVAYELWLPVGRVDAVVQSLAMLDKSWRLAASLVAAADRGSRPAWPLEDLIADPQSANLRIIAVETGSFSSVLRASLKSARQSPVKTALAAGGLIAIPPAIADNVKLIFPDRPPTPCPIQIQAPPDSAQNDLLRLLGGQPAGTVVTTTIELGDGRKLVISGKSLREEAPPPQPRPRPRPRK